MTREPDGIDGELKVQCNTKMVQSISPEEIYKCIHCNKLNIETATLRHRIALLVKSAEDKKRMTKVLHQLTLMNFGFTVER